MTDSDPKDKLRRKARRAIFIGYFCLVCAVIAVSVAQVAHQVYSSPSSAPPVACAQELSALMGAVDRATLRAHSSQAPADECLLTFRADLRPEWDKVESLRKACSNTPHAEALDAIEQLRYAEEHAVRRDSVELTSRRRQARLMLDQSLQADKR